MDACMWFDIYLCSCISFNVHIHYCAFIVDLHIVALQRVCVAKISIQLKIPVNVIRCIYLRQLLLG